MWAIHIISSLRLGPNFLHVLCTQFQEWRNGTAHAAGPPCLHPPPLVAAVAAAATCSWKVSGGSCSWKKAQRPGPWSATGAEAGAGGAWPGCGSDASRGCSGVEQSSNPRPEGGADTNTCQGRKVSRTYAGGW